MGSSIIIGVLVSLPVASAKKAARATILCSPSLRISSGLHLMPESVSIVTLYGVLPFCEGALSSLTFILGASLFN